MSSAFIAMLVFPPDVNFKSIIENDEYYGKHKVILLLQTCTASLTLSVMYVVTTHKLVGRLYMLTCICYLCYCATLLLQTKLRKTKMMLRKIHRQSAQQEAYVFTIECSSKEVFCFLRRSLSVLGKSLPFEAYLCCRYSFGKTSGKLASFFPMRNM